MQKKKRKTYFGPLIPFFQLLFHVGWHQFVIPEELPYKSARKRILSRFEKQFWSSLIMNEMWWISVYESIFIFEWKVKYSKTDNWSLLRILNSQSSYSQNPLVEMKSAIKIVYLTYNNRSRYRNRNFIGAFEKFSHCFRSLSCSSGMTINYT